MARLRTEPEATPSGLEVRLFGLFRVRFRGKTIDGPHSRKAQEFFAYLLAHRDRPHLRENLASVFWEDGGAQTRKNLRQTLWQLQSALASTDEDLKGLVQHRGTDWIRIDPSVPISTDVESLRQAHKIAEHTAGRDLEAEQAGRIADALDLYHGEFLEGCYSDWCLFERERLRDAYLLLLDRMMSYCQATTDYRGGIDYGTLILKQDRARERTYRRLMRLYYYDGDRTASLRQYQRCVGALRQELQVGPAHRTVELHEAIRSDRLRLPGAAVAGVAGEAADAADAADSATTAGVASAGAAGSRLAAALPTDRKSPFALLDYLVELRTILSDARQQVHSEIQALERARGLQK